MPKSWHRIKQLGDKRKCELTFPCILYLERTLLNKRLLSLKIQWFFFGGWSSEKGTLKTTKQVCYHGLQILLLKVTCELKIGENTGKH